MWFFQLINWLLVGIALVAVVYYCCKQLSLYQARFDQIDEIVDRLEKSVEFLDAMARFHYKAASGEPLLNRPIRYEESIEDSLKEPEQAEPGKAEHHKDVNASLFGL